MTAYIESFIASVGFNGPAEVPTTNLIGWWSADSLGLANGTAVSSWPSMYGIGPTMSQATTTAQPIYTTNVINGRPALSFNGTSDTMQAASTISGLVECWVVAYYNAANFSNYSGLFSGVNNVNGDLVFTSNRYSTYWYSTAWTGSPASWNNGAAVSTTSFVGPMQTWKIQTITTTSFSGSLTPQVANDRSLSSRYWSGYIAEILCFNTQLTAGQQAQVDTYLSGKYGISVSDSMPYPALVHSTTVPTFGGLSSTGTVNKSTTIPYTGGISFAGSNANTIVRAPLVAVLTMTGGLVKRTTHLLQGVLSWVGELTGTKTGSNMPTPTPVSQHAVRGAARRFFSAPIVAPMVEQAQTVWRGGGRRFVAPPSGPPAEPSTPPQTKTRGGSR